MPSRTSRTVRREHFNARAISRKPRPSDSRRLISAYRSTVNFLRAIATPSVSCKTDDGTGPDRHPDGLRGWSQSEEIGWVQFQEIRWSPSQEIGWSQSEEILHGCLALHRKCFGTATSSRQERTSSR